VPADVHVDERPPASVEAAAYFVVGEALANFAKHAKATSADVTVRRNGERLVVKVEDDGITRGGLGPGRSSRPRGRARRRTAPALAPGRTDGPDGGDPVRIVIAEDGVRWAKVHP
jgi:hypothetical protein